MGTFDSAQELMMKRYRLDPDWVNELDGDSILTQNWRYDPRHGNREGLRYFAYRSLAGLAVMCSVLSFSSDELNAFPELQRKSIINLGVGQDVKLTSTKLLAAAFMEYTEQDHNPRLVSGDYESPVHMLGQNGNETFAIPTGAAILAGSHFVYMQLPHQRLDV